MLSSMPPAEMRETDPTDADLETYWDDDPDTVLVEMAARLDRRTVDRLFGDI